MKTQLCNYPRESGWAIFQTGNDNHISCQVQRLDECKMLPDDEAAIRCAKAVGVPCDEAGCTPVEWVKLYYREAAMPS